MTKPKEIWTAIDRLAKDKGYSTSGLAKKHGLNPSALNRSKRTNKDGSFKSPERDVIRLLLTETSRSIM